MTHELSQVEGPAPEPSVPAAPPRSKWPKRILFAALAVVILFAVLWNLAPGIVRSRVEAALEESLHVEASVEGVSLSLGGSFGVERVTLVDEGDREVARLEGLTGTLRLGSLLSGALDGQATLERAELTARQLEDGSWDLAALPREDPESEGDDSSDGGSGRRDRRVDLAFRCPRAIVHVVPFEAEPRTLELELAAALQDGDVVTFDGTRVTAPFLDGDLRGRVENLAGWDPEGSEPLVVRAVAADLTYTPDALREALAPFLELDLRGAEPERLVFELQGDLRGFEPAALARALRGKLSAGVGSLTVADFTTTGALEAILESGRLTLDSDLGLNGGAFDLKADVDLAGFLSESGAYGTTFEIGLGDVALAREFAPLLAPLHPVLAASEQLAEGTLAGTLDAALTLDVAAPLSLRRLLAEPDSFPLSALNASGTLGLEAMVQDAPLVAELARALDVDLSRGARLSPFSFAIEQGRVGYEKPWTWTIDGLETSFTGSVGLDRTLDLIWNVPISDRLAERSSLLERLRGKALAIPLTGSVLDPTIGVQEALTALAGDALRGSLEEELLERLEELDVLDGTGLEDWSGEDGIDGILKDLEGQLGGGSDAPGTDPAASNDPAVLLREADRLWKAGDKAAAQPIYERIEKQFKLSPPYLLNKSRVKKRADWKAPD